MLVPSIFGESLFDDFMISHLRENFSEGLRHTERLRRTL